MSFSDHSVTGYAGVNDFAFLLLKRLDCVEILFVLVRRCLQIPMSRIFVWICGVQFKSLLKKKKKICKKWIRFNINFLHMLSYKG